MAKVGKGQVTGVFYRMDQERGRITPATLTIAEARQLVTEREYTHLVKPTAVQSERLLTLQEAFELARKTPGLEMETTKLSGLNRAKQVLKNAGELITDVLYVPAAIAYEIGRGLINVGLMLSSRVDLMRDTVARDWLFSKVDAREADIRLKVMYLKYLVTGNDIAYNDLNGRESVTIKLYDPFWKPQENPQTPFKP